MPAYLYKITTPQELAQAVMRIGADPRSIPFFDSKKEIISLFISDVDTRAANVIKQEMLSRSGDVIVHKNSIDRQIDKTDIILLGTKKQYGLLSAKLEQMPYWGLDMVKAQLDDFLSSFSRQQWTVPLPGREHLALGNKTIIMGIMNLTADSFYPASRIDSDKELRDRAIEMANKGAVILDIGAESTRPGAERVSLDQELERIIPAVRLLRESLPNTILSVDTYKSEVAREAVLEGAHIINDISGMTYDSAMTEVIASSGAAIIINHVKGTPADMQDNPVYEDILGELTDHFRERIDFSFRSGIAPNRIILDPGIGFGKRMSDNLLILKHLTALRGLGFPLMIGHSRKSFLGKINQQSDSDDRLEGTLAISALCAFQNVQIIRVHDIEKNMRVINTINAVKEAQL